ncbi:uncharacterized protein PV07_09985 [Cladophialophora immunda]|uniref:Uncharacterized protein n=1 Tax=Cladophialophora immunda TaxID=569365 RepID=A0A0D2AH98_9EURO|nr:uncharacterized protein PV07_09985 [Cladophialophora immunda]KIW24257.1 hypothetical protein PV07_09985 [Cladophialophora immunda]OQV09590.1 hypothetical protein CLAIMM_13697 [Cladophialophora immunda]
MSNKIPIFIENRKNQGINPNTTAQLPNDGILRNFEDLERQPKFSPILATHLTHNTPGVTVSISGGSMVGVYDLKTNIITDITRGGGPIDISKWSVIANKHQ